MQIIHSCLVLYLSYYSDWLLWLGLGGALDGKCPGFRRLWSVTKYYRLHSSMLQNSMSPSFLILDHYTVRSILFEVRQTKFRGLPSRLRLQSTVTKPLHQFWSLQRQRGVTLWQALFYICIVTVICLAVWHVASRKSTHEDRLRVSHNWYTRELGSIGYVIGHATSARWLVRPDALARWRKPPCCGWFQ